MAENNKGSDMLRAIAQSTLGTGLMNAMISKQKCVEKGMEMEAGVFESTIQRFRTELTECGLNPDEVIQEQVRLLEQSLKK